MHINGYGFLGGTKVCTRTRTLELPVALPAGISVPVTIPIRDLFRKSPFRLSQISSAVPLPRIFVKRESEIVIAICCLTTSGAKVQF